MFESGKMAVITDTLESVQKGSFKNMIKVLLLEQALLLSSYLYRMINLSLYRMIDLSS